MSTARPSKDNPVQPSYATAPLRGAILKAQDKVETARDLIACTHQVVDTTRQLVKNKKEILQYNQAWRERQAEQGAAHATTGPHEAGLAILLISESPADIVRFRHALEESALPYQMKFLMDRSKVEAFVRQATTSAPLFLPRLIITECQLPCMEAEEIVAAVRAVPAYHSIPILLFGSLEAREGHRRCRQCGATAFVRKPNTWQALVRAVASMVHGWGGGGDSRPF
jgi:CheY-like chemotaxis protein